MVLHKQLMPAQYGSLEAIDVPAAGNLPSMQLARLTTAGFAEAYALPELMVSGKGVP